MFKVKVLDEFKNWLHDIKDPKAKVSISSRVKRLEFGLFGGNVKPVGSGISELKIDIGKGYRVYFKQQGDVLIIVLCGSEKQDQQKQIQRAKELVKQWDSKHE